MCRTHRPQPHVHAIRLPPGKEVTLRIQRARAQGRSIRPFSAPLVQGRPPETRTRCRSATKVRSLVLPEPAPHAVRLPHGKRVLEATLSLQAFRADLPGTSFTALTRRSPLVLRMEEDVTRHPAARGPALPVPFAMGTSTGFTWRIGSPCAPGKCPSPRHRRSGRRRPSGGLPKRAPPAVCTRARPRAAGTPEAIRAFGVAGPNSASTAGDSRGRRRA